MSEEEDYKKYEDEVMLSLRKGEFKKFIIEVASVKNMLHLYDSLERYWKELKTFPALMNIVLILSVIDKEQRQTLLDKKSLDGSDDLGSVLYDLEKLLERLDKITPFTAVLGLTDAVEEINSTTNNPFSQLKNLVQSMAKMRSENSAREGESKMQDLDNFINNPDVGENQEKENDKEEDDFSFGLDF